MKRAARLVAILFFAGLMFFGIGVQLDGELGASQIAMAASDKPTLQQCQVLEDAAGKISAVSQNVTEAEDCSPCLWAAVDTLRSYLQANC